jgi:hypothetical protein
VHPTPNSFSGQSKPLIFASNPSGRDGDRGTIPYGVLEQGSKCAPPHNQNSRPDIFCAVFRVHQTDQRFNLDKSVLAKGCDFSRSTSVSLEQYYDQSWNLR